DRDRAHAQRAHRAGRAGSIGAGSGGLRPAFSRRPVRALAALPALLLLAGAGAAQEPAAGTATVQGRVRDEVGAAVYAATALLLRDGVAQRLADTDRLGLFRMDDVPAGRYLLRVTGLGHAPSEVDLTLEAGEARTLELVLP